jgi:hypothetical protein
VNFQINNTWIKEIFYPFLIEQSLNPLVEKDGVDMKELHQGRDFRLGTPPVLGREGIKSQNLHTETPTGFHRGTDRLRTGAVALNTGEVSFLGPASVAVHDYGYMRGDLVLSDLFEQPLLVRLVCRIGYDPGDLVPYVACPLDELEVLIIPLVDIYFSKSSGRDDEMIPITRYANVDKFMQTMNRVAEAASRQE